jgi:hypothetical protein
MQNTNTPSLIAAELVDRFAGVPTGKLIELAYLRGHADALRAVQEMDASRQAPRTHYDNTLLCRRCAARVSMPGSEPLDPLTPVVCIECAADDSREVA